MMNPIGEKPWPRTPSYYCTLPETNILAPENWCLEDDPFLFGAKAGVFAVSFREGTLIRIIGEPPL